MFNTKSTAGVPEEYQEDSYASEIFNSESDHDTSIMKFDCLMQKLQSMEFSNDKGFDDVKEMLYGLDLSNHQWKQITSLLIDKITNKKNSGSSEPKDEKPNLNKSGMSINLNNENNQTNHPKKRMHLDLSQSSDDLNIENHQKSLKKKRMHSQLDLSQISDDLSDVGDQYKLNCGSLWGKCEEQIVPFDIGMKILEDNIDVNSIGIETKQKIKLIEDDACKMAMKRMRKKSQYQKLFEEKEHWKYLAKTRLIELENEIDFRYELVFGHKKNF